MTRDEMDDRWTHAWLLAIAATALGWAIQIRDGLYDPLAFLGLTIALLAALSLYIVDPLRSLPWYSGGGLGWGPFHHSSFTIQNSNRPLPGPPPEYQGREKITRWVFGIAITLNFLQWYMPHRMPGSWHGTPATPFFYLCISLAFLLSLSIVLRPQFNRLLLIALILIFCIVGGWVILRVPQPYMDVWMLQTEGLKAFAHGHNPFSTPFADVYHRPELYLPSAIHPDGLIHQGFPYPPMVLWMELPGQLIAGDYRWSNLAAMALTALLIANTAPGRIGPMAAALFLFTPRALFVLESGWTEPTTALLLAATVFCAVRFPRLMPICLGLFLCSKQYLIWAIPPVMLLAGRPVNRGRLVKILAIAFLTGCAASLPLILWDVKAYLAANVDVAQGTAFRTDALSYLALWANNTHLIPSARVATLIGLTTATAATILVCRRGPRTPAGYAAAVATAHLIFFAFYKFAFCNYDWFLIAAFCCAAGALRPFEKQSPLSNGPEMTDRFTLGGQSASATDQTEPASRGVH